MEYTIETLTGGTMVFTNAQHPITTDSLLLARFCPVKPEWAACDLGSGCGVLLLSLADRGLENYGVGVEIDPEASSLLRSAIAANELINLEAVSADLREYQSPLRFDLVVANPPYYNQGALPQNDARAAARHEMFGSFEDVCAAAARLVKEGGHFCLCWPPARMATLFWALSLHGFAPKRMQLVRKAPAEEPWLVLVDSVKAGGEGLAILPDLLPQPTRAPAPPAVP